MTDLPNTPDGLPNLLSAVTLGPGDKLLLFVGPSVAREHVVAAGRWLEEVLGPGRAVILSGVDQVAVLRATKAEGSTVGQCGDEFETTVYGIDGRVTEHEVRCCHLAFGHTGTHSDGVVTWSPPPLVRLDSGDAA